MSAALPNPNAERRAPLRQDRGQRHFLFGSYHTALMACLIGSLATILLALHLPLAPRTGAVYWDAVPSRERIRLEMLDLARRSRSEGGVPLTQFVPRITPETPLASDDQEEIEAAVPEPAVEQSRYVETSRIKGLKVYDFAETMPEIDGGLRNYYIHIEYPREAAEAGIQGRLVLEFVVEVDGSTSDIHVLQALHPLCDSAAVRALRLTRFIPGRQNGELTRVRMRLPVRFRLIETPAEPVRDRPQANAATTG